MATLDLQEQEQLDAFKAFWGRWGNLITSLVTLCLLAFAGWNGWNWWQRDQGLKASVLFDQVEQAVEAKDAAKAQRMWQQMQADHGRATYTSQAALLVAKAQIQAGKAEEAKAALEWAAREGKPAALRELAQLRLASLHIEAKRYAEAEAALAAVQSPAFVALVADRRGDLAQLQGKADQAREHYKAAYLGLKDDLPYRQLVDAKLTALGVDTSALAPKEAK